MRVRQGPLYSDGAPAALDGYDDLQIVWPVGLLSGVISILFILFDLLVGDQYHKDQFTSTVMVDAPRGS